jgi:hypothetical protein
MTTPDEIRDALLVEEPELEEGDVDLSTLDWNKAIPGLPFEMARGLERFTWTRMSAPSSGATRRSTTPSAT